MVENDHIRVLSPRDGKGRGMAAAFVLHLAAAWLLMTGPARHLPDQFSAMTIELIMAAAPPQPQAAPAPAVRQAEPAKPMAMAKPRAAAAPLPSSAPPSTPASAWVPAANGDRVEEQAAPAPRQESRPGPVAETIPPVATHAPRPAYPRAARQRGMEGVVTLSMDIAADGSPAAISIQASSGFALLDEAAVQAAKAWRFTPARNGGEAVAGKVVLPVRFQLMES